MKRILAVIFSAAMLCALAGSAHAYKFDMTFDAGSDGITINFTTGALSLRTQTVQLTGTADPPQTLTIIPGLFVELSIVEIAPKGKPQLILHYVITSEWFLKEDQEADITIPFEHGYITNRRFHEKTDPNINYDAEGVVNVTPWRSRYSLRFTLPNLNGIFEAHATWKTNEIHQTINSDNGLLFGDVNLVFHPRLLYNKVTYDVTMTPQSSTWPSPDFSTFTGTLPVPYGSYYFWLYRDSKN